MQVGAILLVDDGKVRLEVKNVGPEFALVEVIAGEALSDRKGVTAPGLTIPTPALTAKDRADLGFRLSKPVSIGSPCPSSRAPPTWPSSRQLVSWAGRAAIPGKD